MEIFINHGILHIIDNERGQVVLSESELDLDSDMVTDFLTRHIKKIWDSAAAKEATFNAESAVFGLISSYMAKEIDFKNASWEMCVKLAEIMLENGDIPPADILFTQFDMGGTAYLAIFKLNHSVFYTHEIKGGENHIVQSAFALPFGGGKVTEAVIIPFNPMVLRIMEKSHNVGGEEVNYFSQLFLDAAAQLSKKEAAKLIKDILADTVEEHCDGNLVAAAKFQLALIEEAIENDGDIRLESVAAQAFGDSPANKGFIAAAREVGLARDIFLGEKFCMKEFGTAKIKSHNGIEIKLPVGLMDDPNAVEFIDNGSAFDISIKDFRKG